MTDTSNWLNIQKGATSREAVHFHAIKRYIFNNRTLSEYVHRDVLFQAYLNAALVMIQYGKEALDDSNPYKYHSSNQDGFTSLGAPYILDLVTKAGNLALSGAWFQKWDNHLHLRPEAFGGRIHHKLTKNRSYDIHQDILNSKALDIVYSKNGTYLCPQAYPEGSPVHPSYPAGHATVAGACVTILKALFNESFIIRNAVVSNDKGSELVPYNLN